MNENLWSLENFRVFKQNKSEQMRRYLRNLPFVVCCLFVCQLNGLQKQHTTNINESDRAWVGLFVTSSAEVGSNDRRQSIYTELFTNSSTPFLAERALNTRRRLKCVQKSVKHSNCASRHVQTDRSLSSSSMQLLLRLKVHDCAPSRITFSRSDIVAESSSKRAFLARRINHLSSRARSVWNL